MSKEIYTIIGVGVALAAIMLTSQVNMRSEHAELRSAITELRSDMREDFAAVRGEMAGLRTEMADLTERVIRIEVMQSPSTDGRDAGQQ